MSDTDYEYFRQRERHERSCAEQAHDQAARRVHLDMADRYADRVREMISQQQMKVA